MKRTKNMKTMEKRRTYRSVCILVIAVCLHGNAQKRKSIIIDAGHGGIDSGAISKDGLTEKEVVLDIALWMVYWNRELFDDRADIYLTRHRDTLVSLSDRTRLAKALKPDLFLSLHCNHAADPQARGSEAYVHPREGKYSEVSIGVARALIDGLNEKLGLADRGIKYGDFQVLRDNRGACPAVLLELGFLSRKEESGYLGEVTKRKALALAVLEAVYRGFSSLDGLAD